MLTRSVGLVVALAATACDRTFGAAFFQKQKCTLSSEHLSHPKWPTIPSKLARNLLGVPRGGSTAALPTEDEEKEAVEEILYLPGNASLSFQSFLFLTSFVLYFL